MISDRLYHRIIFVLGAWTAMCVFVIVLQITLPGASIRERFERISIQEKFDEYWDRLPGPVARFSDTNYVRLVRLKSELRAKWTTYNKPENIRDLYAFAMHDRLPQQDINTKNALITEKDSYTYIDLERVRTELPWVDATILIDPTSRYLAEILKQNGSTTSTYHLWNFSGSDQSKKQIPYAHHTASEKRRKKPTPLLSGWQRSHRLELTHNEIVTIAIVDYTPLAALTMHFSKSGKSTKKLHFTDMSIDSVLNVAWRVYPYPDTQQIILQWTVSGYEPHETNLTRFALLDTTTYEIRYVGELEGEAQVIDFR
jgi:hypothetical protein